MQNEEGMLHEDLEQILTQSVLGVRGGDFHVKYNI